MDNNTLLLRQVHPSWIVGDIISQQIFSSLTFKPTPKDEGLLSEYFKSINQFEIAAGLALGASELIKDYEEKENK